MSAPGLSERALVSVLYDGEVVRTPWPPASRWTLPVQSAHADDHRARVRARLLLTGQARLLSLAATA